MLNWKNFLRVVCPLIAVVVPCALSAAEPIDLARTTPVPSEVQIPLADFFRPAVIRDPKIDPTGTHVAAMFGINDERYQLLSYELTTQKIDAIMGLDDKDISYFEWLNDKRLLFGVSTPKLYGYGLFVAEVGKFAKPSPLIQYWGARFVSIPMKNRLRPLVWMSADIIDDILTRNIWMAAETMGDASTRDSGVAAINTDVQSGRVIDLLKSGYESIDVGDARQNNEKHLDGTFPPLKDGLTSAYLSNKDGELEFGISSNGGALALHHLSANRWEKTTVDLASIDVYGSGNEVGQVTVLGPRQEGKPRALQFLEPATGQLGDVLLQDDTYDFNGYVYRDRALNVVVGAAFERNGPNMVWFTEGYQKLQKILDGFFPSLVVRILSANEAANIYLVETYSDHQPPTYSWIDLQKRTAGLIKNTAPWIDSKRMQAMNTLKFKTRDGRKLDAYLTLPAGASKKNPPPLVVLPHGGPWTRDTWGYNGEVQFLASRGYAVLQPNYRGSPGYGWMFPAQDELDFRKMSDDVTDATKAIIAAGYADASRVAIVGTGFGGNLAIAGIENEHELYRCAVSIAGVFDNSTQLSPSKFYDFEHPNVGRMERLVAAGRGDKGKFDASVPLQHVDQVLVPVFVSNGKNASDTDTNASKQLISELEKHNVSHESLIVSNDSPGVGHLKDQVEIYSRVEAFLAKNLKATK